MTELLAPVSFGEMADKVGILQIKRERIREPQKRASVEAQLAELGPLLFGRAAEVAGFAELFARLKAINERLWDIEDALRRHERQNDFGPEFVRLARAVYLTNDERAGVKRELDVLLGSRFVEEKSYGGSDASAD
jgi:hypothetical protein